jgi:hypothetical protein
MQGTIVERMSKNAMLITVDALFEEMRGHLFEDKFEQLFKAEDILNKIGFHLKISPEDTVMLNDNRSGRIILKVFDSDNRFIGRQLVYFWTYNTTTGKYHLFGQLQ